MTAPPRKFESRVPLVGAPSATVYGGVAPDPTPQIRKTTFTPPPWQRPLTEQATKLADVCERLREHAGREKEKSCQTNNPKAPAQSG